MSAFFSGAWLIATLELRQRVRGLAWYVLLGVFVVVLLGVSVLLTLATDALVDGGGGIYSAIILFVLLLASLVSPALSGNAINGERDTGTLATTQVTLISTGQLVIGKWMAAWITALAFLAAAVPFLIYAVILGEVSLGTISGSVLVLALELGVIAAIGVGLSGIITRPLFSIVVTYLVIAALSLGTLIVFGLAGAATQSATRTTYTTWDPSSLSADGEIDPSAECTEVNVSKGTTPRFDRYWGILAANPYVILADAAPAVFDAKGTPKDAFTWLAVSVRQVQQPPDLNPEYNDCDMYSAGSDQPYPGYRTPQQNYEGTTPSWFVGLPIEALMGIGALAWAWRRLRTPAQRLPKGMRIA